MLTALCLAGCGTAGASARGPSAAKKASDPTPNIDPPELRAMAGEWNCDETMMGHANGVVTISAHPAVNGFWMELDWIGRQPDFPIMRGMARGDSLHLFDRGGRYGNLQRIPSVPGTLAYEWPDGKRISFTPKEADLLEVLFPSGNRQSCQRASGR